MENEDFKTVKQFDKEIAWLKDYRVRWDACNESQEATQDYQNKLIDEYFSYCDEHGLDKSLTLDNLIEELEAQRGCTEDGKF